MSEKSFTEHVLDRLDEIKFAASADAIKREQQIESGEVLRRSSLLRCECENGSCESRPNGHRAACCKSEPTIKIQRGFGTGMMICAACAEFMPGEYLTPERRTI